MSQTDSFNPLVSIVIPVYNGSNYMREAIDSALAQTYENIEVVVVNDGSTDTTEKIAKTYGNKITYISKENGGVSTALNVAIKNANGKYISWLSHDDIYDVNKIKVQVNKLREIGNRSRLNTIIYTDYTLINHNSDPFYTKRISKIYNPEKLNNAYYVIFNGLAHGCSLLIPRKCFDEVSYFDESLFVSQDYDLWFKMFPKYNLQYIDKSLVYSRVHADQGSKTIETGSKERAEGWIDRIESLTDEDMKSVAGSVTNFLTKSRDHFNKAKYYEVVDHLDEMLAERSKRDIESIKVSIIVPFHNRVMWVKEAIESALIQTHNNIELILIDDHSTEDVSDIYKIGKEDSRIQVLSNKGNRGAGAARNLGLNHATGDFISFLDSDDKFEKEKIESQLSFMVANNVSFSHTSYSLFSDNEKVSIKSSGKINYKYPDIIAGCSIACPTVLVEREIIENEGLRFPEEYLTGQDVCYWISLSRIADCIGIDQTLTKVRKHDSNVAYDNPRFIQGVSNIQDYVVKNHMTEVTAPHIIKLNATLNRALKQLSNVNVPDLPSDSPDGLKKKIKKKLVKILKKISPLYRAEIANRERLDFVKDKSNDLLRIGQAQDKRIDDIKLELKAVNHYLYQLKNNLSPPTTHQQDGLINLRGNAIRASQNRMNMPLEYEMTSSEFHQKMKENIAKTDIVLDIGCGIRPQNFFTPKVHICIEPFEQYREIIKPHFPDNSTVLFFKEDALKSMEILDDNSVDSVFLLDLIEHLDKEDGHRLLSEADRVARKQIIVYTPLGFYPMHFQQSGEKDAWGLDGNELQEHKSGWEPKDFGKGWDFYICKNCHPAFLKHEIEKGVRYSALMAIRTKKPRPLKSSKLTPDFVSERMRGLK